MDFKTAMNHYRDGTASPEERLLVEEELEKSRLIAEYLDSQWESEATEEVPGAEMKKVRKSLRKRNALIVLTSLVLAAALLFATVQFAIPALEKQYWDPRTRTLPEGTWDITLTMNAYSELFSPNQNIYSVGVTRTGFAAYSLSVAQWHRKDHGDISYLTASLDKGELIFPDGFWEFCPANIFERATYPFYFQDEAFDLNVRQTLSQLPDYIEVTAAVSFPEDLSMEELIAFQDSLEDGYVDWVGIRNSEPEEQRYPLCGMKPFSGGLYFEHINESYPYFDIKGMEDTSENFEAHFKALLQYSQDQFASGTGIDAGSYAHDSYYQLSLDYIAQNGVYAYGCFVSGPPQLFLELLDSGTASQIWIQDTRISA